MKCSFVIFRFRRLYSTIFLRDGCCWTSTFPWVGRRRGEFIHVFIEFSNHIFLLPRSFLWSKLLLDSLFPASLIHWDWSRHSSNWDTSLFRSPQESMFKCALLTNLCQKLEILRSFRPNFYKASWSSSNNCPIFSLVRHWVLGLGFN